MADTLFSNISDVETVRATIDRIVYNENGRVIAKIIPDPSWSRDPRNGNRKPTTALGSMMEPMVGQLYEFTGKIVFNDRFKTNQLEFEGYRTIPPTDERGIFSYLVDIARWVGPSTAKAIVSAFGTETLHILKTEPERVVALGLRGLGQDRVSEMQKSLVDNEALEAATVECNNILSGVLGPAQVRKAIRKWKCDAAHVIKANPYQLMQIHGIGFVSADNVHTKLGGDPRAMIRHGAALAHILGEAAQKDGHTRLTLVQVQAEGQRLVGGLRPEVLDLCIRDGSIETDTAMISLGSLAKAEQYIAGKITSALRGLCIYASPQDGGSLNLYPRIPTDGLADDQAAAARAFTDAPIFILCGAPGTGKTFTTARLVKALNDAGLRVGLCAPTGKAAKQMSLALAQVAGGTAVTIHSLLEPTVDDETGEFYFARDEHAPLPFNVLVIDETSMVDINLMRSLLRAVPETSRILIVGDHYQLPSVGPGAVLRDLLRAGVPSVELTMIKRNAGTIVRACHAIKDGRIPEPAPKLDLSKEDPDNWRHIEAGDPDDIKAKTRRIILEQLPKFSVDPFWGFQIISPTNEKGELSCESLNKVAKELINPAGIIEQKLGFGLGDKVVRLKNGKAPGQILPEAEEISGVQRRGGPEQQDQEIRIVNGDVGIVSDIESKTVTVQFRYPNRVVRLPRADANLRLAYCMTCHKMQGSEVPVVILPINAEIAKIPIVTREWIYTAISRAKLFIITIGSLAPLGSIIRRVGNTKRQTGLAERILFRQAHGNSRVKSEDEIRELVESMDL